MVLRSTVSDFFLFAICPPLYHARGRLARDPDN